MPTSGKKLLRAALKEGWRKDRQTGSHVIVVKEGHKPVSIPLHANEDLPKGTEMSIRKKLGLKRK